MKTQFVGTLVIAGGVLLQLHAPFFHSRGAPGDVDPSFFPGAGLNGQAFAVALQSDGKVVLVGDFGVTRLNQDGASDQTIRGDGALVGASSLAIQTDGKLLVGYSGGVARLNADGSADTSFTAAIDPSENSAVYAVAALPDGKILIGGSFGMVNGASRAGIARLHTNGSVDLAFNPNFFGSVFALSVQSDGKALIGGRLTTTGGNKSLVRLNADGSLDGTFNASSQPDDVVISLAVQNDGRIVAGGYFTIAEHNHIVRLNENGDVDTTFKRDARANNTLFSVGLQSDGKLLIAGGFTEVNGVPRNKLARLHADGSLDDSFNPGANFSDAINIHALLVQPDDKLLIAGGFTAISGSLRDGVARLEANGALDGAFYPNRGVNGAVRSVLVQPDGKVLIGGDFETINGLPRSGIARLNHDGGLDATIFQRATGRVNALALQTDSKILIGTEHGLVRVQANGALDSAFIADIGTGDDTTAVTCLAVQGDGKIIVGGFGKSEVVDPNDGSISVWNRLYLTRLHPDGRYDSSFERTLEQSFLNDRYSPLKLAPRPDGKILVAGYFFTFKGANHAGIARLHPDGTLDTTFNVGANNSVAALTLQPDGKIFIAGGFTVVDGASRRRIARLHADGTLDTSFDPGAGADDAISAIALQADGKLLIAGLFNNINNTSRRQIARLNANGVLDSAFITFPESAYVQTVALQADGKVIIGGSFKRVNGWSIPHVARLNGDSFSLAISRSEGFVTVSWPLSAPSVQLEETITLSPPNTWSLVTQSTVTNANQISVGVPIASENKFFRLKSQ